MPFPTITRAHNPNAFHLGTRSTDGLWRVGPRSSSVATDDLIWLPADDVVAATAGNPERTIPRALAAPNVAPTATEYPSPITGDRAKTLLPDGSTEYWSHDGTAWVKTLTHAPAAVTATVLDGNEKTIVRANSILNAPPTAIEVPSPINGDTAQVVLADKTIELWSHNGTAWARTTALTYVTGTSFTPGFGTITNQSPAGNTDAVANWGLLGDGTPLNTDRFYFAATAGNVNKTVTGANLKAFLAAPDEIVDVSGVTFPIAFPVATLPGTPVFAPATPTSATAVYKIVTGANLAYAAWNGTQYISSPAPAASVLDGNDKHIVRANATASVAPTALECPSPISGDTAKVRLSNGNLEYWSFGTAWVRDFVDVAGTPDVVTVAGATLPVVFPVATIPGAPAFTPATPTATNIVYVFPNGQTATWNGTQYVDYVAPGNDFWRSGTGTSTPDGLTDPADAIARTGLTGLGFPDPSQVKTNLDVDGSFSLRVRNLLVAATAVVVANNDSILGWSGAGEQLVTLPSAALFPRRIITLRTLTEATVLKVSAVAGNVEHPDSPLSAVVELKGLAVRSATWQSDSANWRLIDWTKTAYYPTTGYTAPAGTASVSSLALPAPAAGVPTQLPNTISSFGTADGNYAALVALPASNNSTGRYSFYSGATLATQIATTNTDLPVAANITTGQSIHFEWSDGSWRWVPSPEPVATQQQTLFQPNNTINGVLVGANIPATAQAFRTTDGAGYASPLILPPVDIYSEPITISNFATANIQIAATNQTGGPQSIANGGQITFVPTTGGWQEEHAKVVNGHTKFGLRGTYAAPLTGAISFPAFSHGDYLLIVAAGATIPLPAANIWTGRRIEIKKVGAGTATFTGAQTIDGVAGRTLINVDEAVTLTSDGATWVRS